MSRDLSLDEFISELNSLSLEELGSSNGLLEKELSRFCFKYINSGDLEKFTPILWRLIEANYHSETLLLTAFIVNDSELIKLAGAVKTMQDSKHYVDIVEVKQQIFDLISSFGIEKFGDSWNRYIFS
jgi:hypothetical protein